MAINILSIPAINNKLKKVFFEIRRTVSWDKRQIILKIMK
jgi:hypothetical protein